MRFFKRKRYEVDAGFDEPDSRDYKYGEMFGTSTQEKKLITIHNSTWVQDQSISRTPSTRMACGAFAMSHIINEHNTIDRSWLWTSGEDLRARQLQFPYRGSEEHGSYLQDNMKQAIREGFITGYSKLESIEEIEHSLQNFRLIYTGSKQIDWKATRNNNNIAVKGSSYGHLFAIVGYDAIQAKLICKNSYGTSLYENGYFYLPYDLVEDGILYSTYSIADAGTDEKRKRRQELVGKIKNK